VRPIERSHRTIVAPRERDDNLVKEFGVGLYDVVPTAAGTRTIQRGDSQSAHRCSARRSAFARIGVPAASGQQLGLARSLHRDETTTPLRSTELTNGEETVILMNGGLLIAQALGQNSATLLVEHRCARHHR